MKHFCEKEENFVHGSSEVMLAIAASCTGSVIGHRDGFWKLSWGAPKNQPVWHLALATVLVALSTLLAKLYIVTW